MLVLSCRRTVLRGESCIAATLVSCLALAAPALGQYDPQKAYKESDAVAARYPDPAVEYKTPAFTFGKADFTAHAEMMSFLTALDQRSNTMRLRIAGQSQEGRDIPALLLTASGGDAEFKDAARPTVLLIGQQHGDEPAGGEAMLALAQRLAEGDLACLLEKINVVIVPRANPDGAEAFKRTTKSGIDVNRDHTLQRTPEGQALGVLFREYEPNVVFDAHEFSVAGRWVTAFGGLQRIDAMIQYATTANIPSDLTGLQEGTFRQPLTKALDAAGLMHDWYYTTDASGKSKTISMGGIGADTGRNVASLRNAVSFLMETRGVGMGRQHLKRRVHTHVVAIEAILRSAADHAPEVVQRTDAFGKMIASTPAGSPFTILSAQTPEKRQITFVEPNTGEDVVVEADWRSALTITPELTRPRPAAYILPPSEAGIAQRLRDLGVEVIQTTAQASIPVETYKVVALKEEAKADVRGTDEGAGDILKGQYALEVTEADIPLGSYVVPLGQPLANLAGIVMEPESTVGYIANRLMAIPPSGVLPILRVRNSGDIAKLKT